MLTPIAPIRARKAPSPQLHFSAPGNNHRSYLTTWRGVFSTKSDCDGAHRRLVRRERLSYRRVGAAERLAWLGRFRGNWSSSGDMVLLPARPVTSWGIALIVSIAPPAPSSVEHVEQLHDPIFSSCVAETREGLEFCKNMRRMIRKTVFVCRKGVRRRFSFLLC